ncbi:LysR family transcriptional regulator [Parashewanella tropica]|uniref:LysR family transcriptional regulator n=1 Tax=Parashewanella tropica TaxID=2547970 RepID=UPI00105A2266|nr:LysR family transcriptional regulator [Parashewanella tropica]
MKTEDIALFHKIVEHGGVNEASNFLYLPKSTISRRLKNLENEISVKLFHRAGRELTLTSAGSTFYQQTLSMLNELETTISEIKHEDTPLKGTLRIQLFPVPNSTPLYEVILEFIEQNPDVNVELYSSAESLDIVKYGIDVAFRADFQVRDAELVARPLFETKVYFFATPEYIRQHGQPSDLEDLQNHTFIVHRFLDSSQFDILPEIDGISGIKMKGCVHTNNLEFAKQAALKHKGIIDLPLEYVQKEVEEGKLVQVLPSKYFYSGKYCIAYPSRAFLSHAASKFVDYIIDYMEGLTEEDVETILNSNQI